MYRALGYDVYQTVNKYYSSQYGKAEDAYGYLIMKKKKKKNLNYIDMRKSMKKDIDKITMKATGKRIQPDELEFN